MKFGSKPLDLGEPSASQISMTQHVDVSRRLKLEVDQPSSDSRNYEDEVSPIRELRFIQIKDNEEVDKSHDPDSSVNAVKGYLESSNITQSRNPPTISPSKETTTKFKSPQKEMTIKLKSPEQSSKKGISTKKHKKEFSMSQRIS